MEFDFTEEQKAFKQEVEDFLKEELPPDWDAKTSYWPAGYGAIPQAEDEFKEFVRQFQIKVGERGWLNLGWPEEHGGMNSWIMNGIADEIMSYYWAPFNLSLIHI